MLCMNNTTTGIAFFKGLEILSNKSLIINEWVVSISHNVKQIVPKLGKRRTKLDSISKYLLKNDPC